MQPSLFADFHRGAEITKGTNIKAEAADRTATLAPEKAARKRAALVADKISGKDGLYLKVERALVEKIFPYWSLYYALTS